MHLRASHQISCPKSIPSGFWHQAAVQRAALEKDRRAHAGTIVGGAPVDFNDLTGQFIHQTVKDPS